MSYLHVASTAQAVTQRVSSDQAINIVNIDAEMSTAKPPKMIKIVNLDDSNQIFSCKIRDLDNVYVLKRIISVSLRISLWRIELFMPRMGAPAADGTMVWSRLNDNETVTFRVASVTKQEVSEGESKPESQSQPRSSILPPPARVLTESQLAASEAETQPECAETQIDSPDGEEAVPVGAVGEGLELELELENLSPPHGEVEQTLPYADDEPPATQPRETTAAEEAPATRPGETTASEEAPATRPREMTASEEVPATQVYCETTASGEVPATRPREMTASEEVPATQVSCETTASEEPRATQPRETTAVEGLPATPAVREMTASEEPLTQPRETTFEEQDKLFSVAFPSGVIDIEDESQSQSVLAHMSNGMSDSVLTDRYDGDVTMHGVGDDSVIDLVDSDDGTPTKRLSFEDLRARLLETSLPTSHLVSPSDPDGSSRTPTPLADPYACVASPLAYSKSSPPEEPSSTLAPTALDFDDQYADVDDDDDDSDTMDTTNLQEAMSAKLGSLEGESDGESASDSGSTIDALRKAGIKLRAAKSQEQKDRNAKMEQMRRILKSAPQEVHDFRAKLGKTTRNATDTLFQIFLKDKQFKTIIATEQARKKREDQKSRKGRWLMRFQLEKERCLPYVF